MACNFNGCSNVMQKNRPVNLDLRQFKFPLTAIASIIHRITGVLLFAGIPFVLYAFSKALESEASFSQVQDHWLSHPLGQTITWLLLSAMAFHLCAGIKHMLMDFGYFETIQGGYIASLVTFVCTGLLAILAGVWVC